MASPDQSTRPIHRRSTPVGAEAERRRVAAGLLFPRCRAADRSHGLASARARRTAMRYARRADASVVGRVWGRLLELEFIDRSVALAAKAFVSFFPLLIAFASVLPVQGRDEMLRVIATRLGVSGAAFDVVRQAFASPDVTRTATGFVGVVVGCGLRRFVHHRFAAGLLAIVAAAARRRPAEQGPRPAVVNHRARVADISVAAAFRGRGSGQLGSSGYRPARRCGGGPRASCCAVRCGGGRCCPRRS